MSSAAEKYTRRLTLYHVERGRLVNEYYVKTRRSNINLKTPLSRAREALGGAAFHLADRAPAQYRSHRD